MQGQTVCIKIAFLHLQDVGDYSYRPHVHLRSIGTASENFRCCRKSENSVKLELTFNIHILVTAMEKKQIHQPNFRTNLFSNHSVMLQIATYILVFVYIYVPQTQGYIKIMLLMIRFYIGES
jgi:hypothetical protein